MRRRSLTAALAAVPLFLSATAGAALADQVTNTLDGTIDATAEVMPLNVGGSAVTTHFYLKPANGDGTNGCNLSGTQSLTVAVVSSDPKVATVSPSSLMFQDCGTNNSVNVTVTPVSEGSGTVSLSVITNNTAGSFDLAPATFTVNVGPGTNSAPTMSISGVTGGGQYVKGSVPPATCVVTDAEDGNKSFDATLSAVTGTYAKDGIGTQTASCSYTDNGGLTASASATYTIYDATAPSVNYTLNPANPDGTDGWYNGDVSLTWNVADSDSPNSLTVTGCENQTITADQMATSYSCAATSAGGSSGPVTASIKRDGTAPTVEYDGVTDGTPGAGDWYTSPVTVSFTATDATSGMAAGTESQTVTQSEDTPGLTIKSPVFTDQAGNSTTMGAAESPTIRIDTHAPNAPTYTLDPTPSNGWNTSDVTVHFEPAGDVGPSGVAYCTPDQKVTVDTTGTTVSGTCTDNAGNVSNATDVIIRRDTNGPQITSAVPVGTKGNGDWWRSDLTVTFTAIDTVSGPDTQSKDAVSSGEGSAVEVDSPAFTDNAGNTTPAGTWKPTYAIDKSAPNAPTAVPDPAPNANGWNNQPVTVTFSKNGDNGPSGVASCSDPVTVSQEGADQTVTGTCSDVAGNVSKPGSATVNLDMTAPVVTYDKVVGGTEGKDGWYTSPVTVQFSATDALSGIDGDKTKTVETGQEGDNVVVGGPEFADLAGNTASVKSEPLKIDTEAPNKPPASLSVEPNSNGWNNQDVIVHFNSAGDNGPSGLAGCTEDIVVSSEGADQTFTGYCWDVAGNQSEPTTVTVNLDKTAPTDITFTGMTDGAKYFAGSVPPAPTCTATDDVSGVVSCVVTGDADPGSMGTHTYTATATNGAGLTSTSNLSYKVVWTLKGFYAPVDMSGVLNTVKGGSTVPLKFEVFSDHELTDNSVVASFKQQQVTCPGASAITDAIEVTSTGETSLRYDSTAGQFIQNWQTPKKPGSCYTVTLTTQDGSQLQAKFMLK